MNRKCYIAGPMTGYEHYNFPAFDAASYYLMNKGFIPISPADIDRALEGWSDYPPEDVVIDNNTMRSFIRRDVAAICECGYIYMLKGWELSKGARAEKAIAEWAGLEVLFEDSSN